MSGGRYVPAGVFMFAFSVLVATAYPAAGWWNTGFVAVCAETLGIPGPGGSILYVLLGRVLSTVLFFLHPVRAIALVNVVSVSLSAALFYSTLRQLIGNLRPGADERVEIAAAAVSAAAVPFFYSIWIEAHGTSEYGLGLLLTGAMLWCAVRIWCSPGSDGNSGLFFLLLYLLAIDFGAHQLNAPFAPVIVILLVTRLRAHAGSPRFWGIAALAAAAGFSMHAYLPVRGATGPAWDLGNTQSWSGVAAWIKMDRLGGGTITADLIHRRAPLWGYQINHMYLRYLAWNFVGKSGAAAHVSLASSVPAVLAAAGMAFGFFRGRRTSAFVLTVFVAYSVVTAAYLNVADNFDRIREIDRLFIPSFYVFALWAGVGMFGFFSGTLRLARIGERAAGPAAVVLAGVGLVVLPVNLIHAGWRDCDKSRFLFPVDYAYNLLNSCARDAVLFTNGDNDTFPLWYAQSMEGVRRDVTVVNLPLLNASFYAKRVAGNGLPVGPNVSSAGPLEVRAIEEPVEVVLAAGGDPPDAEPGRASFSGRDAGGTRYLLPQDQVVLSFLRANRWRRPVYFASTVASSNLCGLDPYLATTGLARKVVSDADRPAARRALEHNLRDVFRYRAFNDRRVAVDRPTLLMYDNIRRAFLQLAGEHLRDGEVDRARTVFLAMEERLPRWRFPEEQSGVLDRFRKRLDI